MSSYAQINTGSGDAMSLSNKISSIRQNAFTLIREIRELDTISYRDLSGGINLHEEVRQFEMRLIRQALEETNGNQTSAANLLGLKLTTLHEKIKRYGIDPHGI
jgi:transcriptional regulator with GAF, ATPase, and Fis domain